MTDGALHLRRYGRDGYRHRHAHVQVVLPVRGTLEIEVGGRGGRVDHRQAVVNAPHTDHDQAAHDDNRFLILECSVADVGAHRVEQLQQRPFVATTPRLLAIANFIDQHCRTRDAVPALLRGHCLPPLLHALRADPAPLQRLQQLCDTITAAHAEPWPVQRMAAYLGMGASRVHALFRDTFDQTPQQWLGALRLQRVCLQLAHTDVPIAQLALVHGWSDQTALTRAMRRTLGMTPAAYRRRQQHAGTR